MCDFHSKNSGKWAAKNGGTRKYMGINRICMYALRSCRVGCPVLFDSRPQFSSSLCEISFGSTKQFRLSDGRVFVSLCHWPPDATELATKKKFWFIENAAGQARTRDIVCFALFRHSLVSFLPTIISVGQMACCAFFPEVSIELAAVNGVDEHCTVAEVACSYNYKLSSELRWTAVSVAILMWICWTMILITTSRYLSSIWANINNVMPRGISLEKRVRRSS